MKKSLILKISSLLLVFALLICVTPNTGDTSLAAQTKSQLQSQIKSINAKQAQLESKLKQLEKDASKQEEYQNELANQMSLSQEKIDTLQASIDIIDAQIMDSQDQIDQKEQDIANTTETFKRRLCAMYKSGNDSVLSIILGSSSFYEMVTSVDMVRRVTEYDKGLVKSMVEQINTLETEKQVLADSKVELDASRDEIAKEVAALSANYEKSAVKLHALENEQNMTEQQYKELADAEIACQKEIEAMIANERRAVSSGYSNYLDPNAYDPYPKTQTATGLLKEYVGGSFIWPIKKAGCYISSYFGTRYDFGYSEVHPAIDIAGGGIYGAPIVAANSGFVKRSQWSNGYGYNVMIDHGGGYFTLYAHCSALACSQSQWVNQGDVIAYVGSTGNSTGPHCHFELWEDYHVVNPLNYVSVP